jgi:hypothetical protein
MEVTEQFAQFGPVRFGQWRLQDRRCIGPKVGGVAGSKQDNIDAGFVTNVSIRRVGHTASALRVDQKPQRIIGFRQPFRNLPGCRQVPHRRGQLSGRAKIPRVTNIISVPIRFAIVCGRTWVRATWSV